ncbi:arylacetamide deacetylase-like 3 [Zootoca vivipara]|uniref:arylacetamide deacetylase-like 3 n=1 Tax=Zootoca vivipara TaxID=8524 RepID=UPI00293BBACC|nr:arylacetamide deacetylase-like 3 [Zootoca vivipara]
MMAEKIIAGNQTGIQSLRGFSGRKMDLSMVMLTFAICFLLCLVALIYRDVRSIDLPPGIDGPFKLFLISITLHSSIRMGSILEKLRICATPTFLKWSSSAVPVWSEPRLFTIDTKFDTVTVRIYQPKGLSTGQRGIIYLYGGAGLLGSIRAYQMLCRYLSRESESVLLCVGQRLGPKHKCPAQIMDCITATEYFLKNASDYGVDPNRIVIAGDSTGGGIAPLVCQHLLTRKDLPKVRAQILLYPNIQTMDYNLPSYQQNQNVPILFKKLTAEFDLRFMNVKLAYLDQVLKGAHVSEEMKMKYGKWIHADNIPDEFKVRGYKPPPPVPFSKELHEMMKDSFEPKYCALLAEDDIVRQLPETYLLTCEYDVLRDDGLLYKKRLEDNGVPVTWHHAKDGFHGILSSVDWFFEWPCARVAAERVISFIKRF